MSNLNNLILSEEDGIYNLKNNITKQEIIILATQLIDTLFAKGETITNPEDTRSYLKVQLGHLEHEVFAVLLLNNKHQIIHFEKLFRGTIDGASVYPREIVKLALKHNAAAIIISHNHPSGSPEPSDADISITGKVKEACALVDIRLLDHIIIGSGNSVSLAERGII